MEESCGKNQPMNGMSLHDVAFLCTKKEVPRAYHECGTDYGKDGELAVCWLVVLGLLILFGI